MSGREGAVLGWPGLEVLPSSPHEGSSGFPWFLTKPGDVAGLAACAVVCTKAPRQGVRWRAMNPHPVSLQREKVMALSITWMSASGCLLLFYYIQ